MHLFELWPAFVAHASAFVVAAYYFALPPPDEVVVVFSWAQLVQMKHSLGAVFETWLARGFGYKFVSYELYLVARWLSSFSSAHETFFAAYNLCVLILISAVATIGTWTIRRSGAVADLKSSTTAPSLFSCLFILLCAVPLHAWAQPEHFALIFTVLIACILFGAASFGWVKFLVCVLLGLAVISQKGLTVLFLVPVWLLALVSQRMPTRTLRNFTLALAASLVAYIACLLALPQELSDLLAAARMQGSFYLDVHSAPRLLRGLTLYSFCQPSWLLVLAFGFAAASLRPMSANGIATASSSGFQSRFALECVCGALILASLVYVLAQGEYLMYHYVMLHLIAALGIVFIVIEWSMARYFIAVSVCAALLAPLLSYTAPVHDTNILERSGELACQQANGTATFRALHAAGYDWNQPILFLTGGGVNYFLDAPSYDRYFYPLPLDRARSRPALTRPQPALRASPMYRQMLQHLLGFDGRFIVWNRDWLDLSDTPELKGLILTHYRQVPLQGSCNDHVSLYQRATSP